MSREESHRVVVVDDEATIAATLALILKRSGYSAIHFTNPLDAYNRYGPIRRIYLSLMSLCPRCRALSWQFLFGKPYRTVWSCSFRVRRRVLTCFGRLAIRDMISTYCQNPFILLTSCAKYEVSQPRKLLNRFPLES